MELLHGENLDERLTRLGPRPATEVVEHLHQVAHALARMHATGVVHRDLKPSNLFLERLEGAPPRIKVLDLGIAKVLSATGGDTTAIVGSVPYMAPEQIRGRAIGPATDLYALGLIAFTLLTGAPFWAQSGDQQAIVLAMRILEGPEHAASVRARALGVELPPAFDTWFARAVAHQPTKRFRSAREAVRGLADALGVEPPAWEDGEPEPSVPAAPLDATDQPSARPALVDATATASLSANGQASTVHDHSAPLPPRWTPRRIAMLSLVTLGGAALVAWTMWPASPPVVAVAPAPLAAASPLAGPRSVVACPILEVDGDPAEWGWLGAAAGSIACERARVILGGLSSRTRVPAELLDLRGDLAVDDEPYGSEDARARSLAAARRADAYLDGSISRLGSGDLAPRLRVMLTLRRPDGTEIRRSSGEGSALYQAVRAAMDGLDAADALPAAPRPDPVIADYSRARDIPTMLQLLDLKLAMVNNAGGLETECARFAAADDATDLASFIRYACEYTFGDPTSSPVLPGGDTLGARVARARIAHLELSRSRDDPAAILELRKQYVSEPSTWAKSVIAATLSCLLETSQRDEALAWAWRAVEDEPKNPTGEWCGPWGQLMSIASDTSRGSEATIKWRVWAPWESYAWLFAARSTKNRERALRYAERAYLLSPLDTNVAGYLGNALMENGQAARVASIAQRLGVSRHPVHQLLSELLTVRFDASETRFARALATAREAMRRHRGDAGWMTSQRLEIAWRAVEIAHVLGRASEIADLAVRELVDPDPPIADWGFLDTARYVTAICAYATPDVARRCFTRLDALKPPSLPPFATGARLFAIGDHRRAADAWRPLTRDADEQLDLLAEPMVRAFTEAGEYDLAIAVEQRTRGHANLFDGASMAMARAAEAHARSPRGDRTEAAQLAKRVREAWIHADAKPPILEQMQKLIP
jgi:tetratricopeptide (TPR) repeat protein